MEKNKRTAVILALGVVAAFLLFGYVYISGDSDQAEGDGADGTNSVEVTSFEKSNMNNPVVTLKTTMGDIVLELFMDKTPITSGNFLELARSGFYTNTKFHRVIDNFMIQGGDPNSKGDDAELYGRGGPGYTIEDEFTPGLSNLRGTISMANVGQPNSGGSQFFINYTNNVGLDYDKQPLTSKHPVFGQVVSGMDIVDAIIRVETNARDLPLEPIVINDVIISLGGAVEPESTSDESEETEEAEAADGGLEESRVDVDGSETTYSFPDFDLGAVSLLNLWAFSE